MNASRQSFIVSALICACMAALFVARYTLAPYPVEAPFEEGMPLAALLTRFGVAHPRIAAFAAAVIVIWTLLLVVQLTIKYAPAASRNYLPSQIFLIGAGGIVVSSEPLAALTAAWLLTLASRQLIFSFHKNHRFQQLFHAGVYLGAIPLVYAPAAAVVLPVAIAALVVYRRSGREMIVCLAGLLLSVPAAGFIHWATGADRGFIYRELWRCVTTHRSFDGLLPLSAALPAVCVLILALISILWVASHKKSIRKTQYRFMHHTSLLLLFLAASAAIPGTSATLAALVAVPCALVVPYAFPGKFATTSTIIYCLAVIAVLALDTVPFSGIPLP